MIEAYLRSQGKVMEQMLKSQISFLGLKDRGKLLRAMRMSVRMRYGAVEALRFKTTRYGMIKIHGIDEGTLVSRRNARTYALKSKEAQDWWTPVAKKMVPQMADKIASIRGDEAVEVSSPLDIDTRKGR